MFSLNSSGDSAPRPPLDASGFENATEFFTNSVIGKFNEVVSISKLIPDIFVISPAGTLSVFPPPYEYCIVNVVSLGASPYVFVFKKFVGSNDSNNFVGLSDKFEPMLSGFGIISSSGLSLTPAPNLNSICASGLLKVVNLFDALFNLSKKGTLAEYSASAGSLSETFSVSSNTVSCAKESTSYQVFPSLSTQLITSIMF